MQVRFKIQSFSSQSDSHPIGNLLSKHACWESARFCDYPQQITIAFYQPMIINSITIGAHASKISARINILYHLPQHNDQGFLKYGYVTFSQSSPGSNATEMKQLTGIDIKACQIRFLLLRNHVNVNNFFNQVGLSSLSFTGIPYDQYVIPAKIMNNKSTLLSFDSQINLLSQLKANFIKKQQFQQAKQVKQILNFIDKANVKMAEFDIEKQRCIKDQDFIGAKRMKEEMLQFKNKITDVVNSFYDPDKKILKTLKTDTILKEKIEQMNLKHSGSFMSQKAQQKTSRVKEQNQFLKEQNQVISEQEDDQQVLQERNQSMISYQDRIIPAVMSRIKGMGQTQNTHSLDKSQIADNQFFQSEEKPNNLPNEPQILGPADQANSSHLLQFYDNIFIRKIHSKYWQFRLQALNQVLTELKDIKNAGPLLKTKLRCYLFIYSISMKFNNYQTTNGALQLMNLLAPMRPQGEFKIQIHNQLENAIKLTIKKLNDSNQKIKSQSEKTLLRIIESPIFGVAICYASMIKSYHQKVSAKLRKIKLQDIEYMVDKYGVGDNGVPLSVVDFALKAANDQDIEVRKSAISLAKVVKAKGGKQRLQSLLTQSMEVKPSILKQLTN